LLALATALFDNSIQTSFYTGLLRIYWGNSTEENYITMSRFLPSRILFPSRRFLSSTTRKGAFATGPAPPRLPPKEQEEFERLQRASTGAFSTPKSQNYESPACTETSQPADHIDIELEVASAARVQATGEGSELHPDIRTGAKPEFEGDRNPKTGEVGGPKNEPLRWGGNGDWSYNGRVTDF
jgi:hypothetical protein